MRIKIDWETETQGVAYVIEPCCEAVKPSKTYDYRDPYFQFNVWRDHGLLEAGFHVDCEDAVVFPLHFCPSCGSPVSVIRQRQRHPSGLLGNIVSGRSSLKEL